MARKYEHYRTGLNKEQIKDLNITKNNVLSLFVDPRDKELKLVTEKHICMVWCTYQPFLDNWMDRWFMVFYKPPCNNREVPL